MTAVKTMTKTVERKAATAGPEEGPAEPSVFFFSRPNLSSLSIEKVADPLSVADKLGPFPKWAKKRWSKWCAASETEHYFVSLCEGLNPHHVISRENPVKRVHGFIADFDVDFSEQDGLDPPKNLAEELYPTYVARTKSGGLRLIWLFTEPQVLMPGVYEGFAQAAAKRLRPKVWAPGWDEPLFYKAGQYYELGRDWVGVGTPLPNANAMKWLDEAGKKHVWSDEGLLIPIEQVRERLADRYPGAWPGGWDGFDIGARGPRFWDDGDNPTAAIVRETGMQCFTGLVPFYPWNHTKLLGAWANQFAEKKVGEVVADVYFDGKRYWMKTPAGVWVARNKDDMRDHLAEEGLNPSIPKDENVSEVTKALNMARNHHEVAGAVYELYRPPGPVRDEWGRRCLNISTLRALSPIAESREWAEGFPWLAAYLEEVFAGDDGRDLQRFLGWLRHAYVGAIRQNFERGLGLIIAGPTSIGKNFLNRGVIGGLMGASVNAESYLVTGDKFNDELIRSPLWMLNDVSVTNRTAYSTLLKQVIANDTINQRGMHVSPISREWLGRVVITCNDDSEGVKVLPRTDINILDKLLILRGRSPSVIGQRYPTNEELREGELPHLAAYLRDSETPREFVGGSRFGIASYADPDLLEEARSGTPSGVLADILDLWRKSAAFEGPQWGPGSATQLGIEISGSYSYEGDAGYREALRTVAGRSSGSLGRLLNTLVKEGVPWIQVVPSSRGGKAKDYIITK